MTSIITITKYPPNRKQKRLDFYNIFLSVTSFLIIVAIALLIIHPQKYMGSILEGINLFFYSVLPSLLPFLFLSKLLNSLGATKILSKLFSPLTKLYKAPRITSFVMLMSFICGYPIGAKLVGELSKTGEITPTEGKKIITLSTTSGPIFVIGAVGAGLFKSVKLGAIIYLVHILSSLIVGYIFTIGEKKSKSENPLTLNNKTFIPSNLLEEATISTFHSVLTVAVYVSIFYMFIDMAFDLKILSIFEKGIAFILSLLNINSSYATGIASGIIEMTRGCKDLSYLSNPVLLISFSSGLISFGGISIIMQSIAFLSNSHISSKYFILVKLTQFVVSIILGFIVGSIIY